MFDFIVVLGSFIDIMMSEIDKADSDKTLRQKETQAANAKVCLVFENCVENSTRLHHDLFY